VRTSTAAVGSAAFFAVAPGTFVGLGPWLITHWEIPGSSPPLRLVLGVVLIVLGLIRLVRESRVTGQGEAIRRSRI